MLLCATLRVRLPQSTNALVVSWSGGRFTLNVRIGLFHLMHRRFHLMRRRREVFDCRSFLMLSNFSCSSKYFLIESKHLVHKYPDSYSRPHSFFLVVSIAKLIKTALFSYSCFLIRDHRTTCIYNSFCGYKLIDLYDTVNECCRDTYTQ